MDVLAAEMGCEYVSDLHFLSCCQRVRLAGKVERIPADAAALFEWNDALYYLARGRPERTAQAAKERLLALLRQPLHELVPMA